jgi:hypothetical protein
LNPLSPGSRRFKLALFDLDGTDPGEERLGNTSIVCLGVWRERGEIPEAFLRGEIDYHRFAS